jgi:hypothetical protein
MIKLSLAQPLGRNHWAATVAPVDHALPGEEFHALFSLKPFLKKACDHADRVWDKVLKSRQFSGFR